MTTSAAGELQPSFAALREGLGSAYERYAVNHLVLRLAREHGVRTAAEWPANGVLGVPGLKSLALARAGVAVTLLHPSAAFLEDVDAMWRAAGSTPPAHLVAEPEALGAAPDDAFDLVWSFCALEHTRDPARALGAMLRASRGVVLVLVQNAWAPGVHLHRLEHRLRGAAWDHGRMEDMSAEAVARHMARAGGEVLALGGCDLPPWPDLDVRLPRPWERDVGGLAARPRRYGPGDAVMTARAVARAFEAKPEASRTTRSLMRWHDAVEARTPRALLRWIAHHPYVLARRAR